MDLAELAPTSIPHPPTSPPRDFPLYPEIVGLVVEHLREDSSSLRKVALVSRSWSFPAQYHLFYSFSLLCWPDNCADKMIHFVEKFPEKLANLIRRITIGWGPPTKRRVRRERREPHLDLGNLVSVLKSLPSLETLTLHACVLENPITSDTPFIRQPLHKLVLADVRGTVSTFNSLLSRIQVNGTVHMLDNTVMGDSSTRPHDIGSAHPPWTRDDPPPSFAFHPRMSDIKELVFESKYHRWQYRETDPFYVSLLRAPTRLTSLDAGSLLCGNVSYPATCNLLKERGRHILRLRLDISWEILNVVEDGHGHGHDLKELVLAKYCPSLQTLHLLIRVFCMPPESRYIKNNVAQFKDAEMLISAAPRTLHTVIIGLDIRAVRDEIGAMKAVEFKRLDTILSSFPALKVVRFQGEWGGYNQTPAADNPKEVSQVLKEVLRAGLYSTKQRGRLQFIGKDH